MIVPEKCAYSLRTTNREDDIMIIESFRDTRGQINVLRISEDQTVADLRLILAELPNTAKVEETLTYNGNAEVVFVS